MSTKTDEEKKKELDKLLEQQTKPPQLTSQPPPTKPEKEEPKPIQLMKLRTEVEKIKKDLTDKEAKIKTLEEQTTAKVDIKIPVAHEFKGDNIKELQAKEAEQEKKLQEEKEKTKV